MKVINAADDLLAEVGFAGVTMEGLAKRAGVAKQTIYRWWPAKTAVLLETLVVDSNLRLTPPDTGSLSDDVHGMAVILAEFLATDDAGRVLAALRAHARLDPEFATAYDEQFAADQKRREELPLRRAVERGELPTDLDIAVERAKLFGPIYEMPTTLLTSDVARTIADQWLAGLRND